MWGTFTSSNSALLLIDHQVGTMKLIKNIPLDAKMLADAMQRLARVLGDQRPHPVDTADGDALRARLVAELRAIGLSPRVADAWACNGAAKSRGIGCASFASIVGTGSSSVLGVCMTLLRLCDSFRSLARSYPFCTNVSCPSGVTSLTVACRSTSGVDDFTQR